MPRWLFVIAGLALSALAVIFVMKSRSQSASAEPVVAVPAPAPEEPVPAEPTKARRLPPIVASMAAPRATVAPPTEEEVRAALREVPITVYSTSWCPQCERARRWLRSNSITFVEHDVEANPAAQRAQRKLNPAGSVPTMDIDGVVEIGFSEKRVGKAIAASVQRRLRVRR